MRIDLATLRSFHQSPLQPPPCPLSGVVPVHSLWEDSIGFLTESRWSYPPWRWDDFRGYIIWVVPIREEISNAFSYRLAVRQHTVNELSYPNVRNIAVRKRKHGLTKKWVLRCIIQLEKKRDWWLQNIVEIPRIIDKNIPVKVRLDRTIFVYFIKFSISFCLRQHQNFQKSN